MISAPVANGTGPNSFGHCARFEVRRGVMRRGAACTCAMRCSARNYAMHLRTLHSEAVRGARRPAVSLQLLQVEGAPINITRQHERRRAGRRAARRRAARRRGVGGGEEVEQERQTEHSILLPGGEAGEGATGGVRECHRQL